jgi:hypothetical protein
MTYHGTVQNGVIHLEGGATLPDGIGVRIEVPDEAETTSTQVEAAQIEEQEPTIGQKLAALARKFENLPCELPEDLAINHDHYLHGLPKRQ